MFGFNGKEKYDEVNGAGNIYDYGFRIYDPRIGRFLSQDPLARQFAYWTPYQYASNNPIYNIDIDGLEGFPANAIQGENGELYVRSKIQAIKGYEVFEQVTVRPDGTTKAYNTRVDLLMRNQSTGNLYAVDVKTGGAVSSVNQITTSKAITKGEFIQIRSAYWKTGGQLPKGSTVKVAGTFVVRTNAMANTITAIEEINVSPDIDGAAAEIDYLKRQLQDQQNDQNNTDNNLSGPSNMDGNEKAQWYVNENADEIKANIQSQQDAMIQGGFNELGQPIGTSSGTTVVPIMPLTTNAPVVQINLNTSPAWVLIP